MGESLTVFGISGSTCVGGVGRCVRGCVDDPGEGGMTAAALALVVLVLALSVACVVAWAVLAAYE